MAIQHQPNGKRDSYDLIRHFRPVGSQTVVWAQDMERGTLIRLLRWGSEIYLPVYDGMKLGIGIFNGSDVWRAYPAYVEALNIWDGGQSQPEDCDTDHMWELKPWMTQVLDKLMNPDAQVGRPLIITRAGSGMTIGEASFGTDEFRGQIRVYERLQQGGGYQFDRPTNEGGEPLGGMTFESYQYGAKGMGNLRGMGELSGLRGGRAGIGAGAEEYQSHQDTGVRYQRNAQPVVFLRVEYRSDLQPMLNTAWGNDWNWTEGFPTFHHWWEQPWDWHKPTAGQVPVTKPHRPNNWR